MYSYTTYDASDVAAGGILATLGALIFIPLAIGLAIAIVMLIAEWKMFKKAGKNGWEAIIPIYNLIVLCEITKINPLFCLVLLASPIPVVGGLVSLALMVFIYIRLAQAFGKSNGFVVGLVLLSPIFVSMLAFGKDTYDASRIDLKMLSFLNNKDAATPSNPSGPAAPETPTTPSEPVTPETPTTPPQA